VLNNDVGRNLGRGWAAPQTQPLTDKAGLRAWVGRSHEAALSGLPIKYEAVTSRPLNPRGRTGMTGRGLLGKWGPNFAADSVITREMSGGRFEVLLILRADTGEWALPGGMVDPGEKAAQAAKREFEEEAANFGSEADREAFHFAADQVWGGASLIYQGYVDDPRNTDNAWLETCCYHFHSDAHFSTLLAKGHAGDDARDRRWHAIDSIGAQPGQTRLYASHEELLDAARAQLMTS